MTSGSGFCAWLNLFEAGETGRMIAVVARRARRGKEQAGGWCKGMDGSVIDEMK